MNIVNEVQVAGEHRVSPKGVFEVVRKHMSLALGGLKDKGPWGGGHPFDVELATIPARKCNYPLHAHAAQTEYYIVVAGQGVFVDGSAREHPIRPGDHVITHPGEAHQMRAGEEPLTYLIIADHHLADVVTYPKTGKRLLKPEYRVISAEDVDYYAGEE